VASSRSRVRPGRAPGFSSGFPAPEATMKPSVLLVDDHRMVAQGLAAYLRETEAYDTIAIATSAAEALARAAAEQPDVIVMDVRLRNETEGIDVLRQVVADNPKARVLMLSAYRQPHWVSQALDAGARGYLLKEAPAEEVHRA